jgi:hypothetical protein
MRPQACPGASAVPLAALCALIALLASCGGGDEGGIVALAFRLDEGSPTMVAYVGDPTEEPFQLPAGRYYVEALGGINVVKSLGTVVMERDGPVDLRASMEATPGAADPEGARPLVTLAGFLIDVELSNYAFLEIVTGGFAGSAFDPAMEPDAAAVRALYETYDEVRGQGAAVMDALGEMEGRALEPSDETYLRSVWAPSRQITDQSARSVIRYLSALPEWDGAGMDEGGWPAVSLAAEATVVGEELRSDVNEGWDRRLEASLLLAERKRGWIAYACERVDETNLARSRGDLEARIRGDIESTFPGDDAATAALRERLAGWYIGRVVEGLPNPA